MGHVYDTGLEKPQRTLIRESIAAKLAPLTKAAIPARYVAAVKSMPRPIRGEGDDDGFAMLIEAVGSKAPLLMVALGRKRFKAGGDPVEVIGEIDVVIYAVSSHARNLVEGRLAGDGSSQLNLAADPGIETMLEHVEERLVGQQLMMTVGAELVPIPGVKELRPGDEDEVKTFAEFTVWEQRYTVEVGRVIDPNRDASLLVTSIQGEHTEDGTSDLPVDSIDISPLVTLANLDPETP